MGQHVSRVVAKTVGSYKCGRQPPPAASPTISPRRIVSLSPLSTPHSPLIPSHRGIFHRSDEQDYTFTFTEPGSLQEQTWTLVTLRPEVDQQLQMCLDQQPVTLWGRLNQAGNWLLVEKIAQ